MERCAAVEVQAQMGRKCEKNRVRKGAQSRADPAETPADHPAAQSIQGAEG